MTSKEKKEEIAELKELFEKARKQYGLPSFDELDEEFEIRKIEDGFVLREIRRDMLDRLHNFIEWIGPIVNPSQHSMHSMIESKLFSKKELDELFDYYRRLYYHIHKGIVAGLKTEKDEADFINELWKLYPGLKKEIAKYMEKIAKGWEEAEEEMMPDSYHS